jgi:uncharacterized protein YneF (UPF0154 family)
MTIYARPAIPPHVRRVVMLGYVALAAGVAYLTLSSKWQDPLLTAATVALLLLGALPMLRWLQRNDDTYPIIEFMLLATVPFYAIPVMTGHEAIAGLPEDLLLAAALVVIVFQVGGIAGSFFARRTYNPELRTRAEWWRTEILPEGKMHFTAYTAVLNTIWIYIASYTNWVPLDWVGTLRAIFFGIGIISIFIQGRLWGSGQLPMALKVLFWVNLLTQTILSFSSLVLVNGISLLLTAAIGYFSVARRVPWLPILLLLPVIGVLHNGKAQMRYIYWEQRSNHERAPDLISYYTQWLEFGLAASAVEQDRKTENSAFTSGLLRRASLYHVVCVAVDTMPARSPFLGGESYAIVPAQLVPRFLWPDKPSPQKSVRLLAIHFGIQTEEATETTSIGFGMLSEAYANFGYVAVGLLGLTFGWLFRRLAISTVECATLSPAGLLRILCLVWCLSAETTLAIWFSSFYQACIAIGVPLLVWKSFFNE